MRYIYLLTENDTKVTEFEKSFALYEIGVKKGHVNDDPSILALLRKRLRQDENEKDTILSNALSKLLEELGDDCLSIMAEESILEACFNSTVNNGNNNPKQKIVYDAVNPAPDGTLVNHQSTLLAYYRPKKPGSKEFIEERYRFKRKGIINMGLRRQHDNKLEENKQVFGWDDIFQLVTTGHTFQQLVELGLKVSPRDEAISSFIKRRIYYGTPISWKYTNSESCENIPAFTIDPFILLGEKNLQLLEHKSMLDCGVYGAAIEGLSNCFFHPSKNRRNKTIFSPGSNTGIPMTPKENDKMQENVYRLHDIYHQLIPDLIFSGETDDLSRFVYIITRILSEATTLVMADGCYVELAIRSGIEYNTVDKRLVRPMLQQTKLFESQSFKENLPLGEDKVFIETLHAMGQFCCTGSEEGLRALLNPHAEVEKMDAFCTKFSGFFRGDLDWTCRNWDYMAKNSDLFRRWSSRMEKFVSALGIDTVASFITRFEKKYTTINLDELRKENPCEAIRLIYSELLDSRVLPHMVASMKNKKSSSDFNSSWIERRQKTAMRWAIGQSLMLEKFTDMVGDKGIASYRDAIYRLLSSGINEDKGDLKICWNADTIENLYALFCDFVDYIEKTSFITPDDAFTFKNCYPAFPPYYLQEYDKIEKRSIRELAKQERLI